MRSDQIHRFTIQLKPEDTIESSLSELLAFVTSHSPLKPFSIKLPDLFDFGLKSEQIEYETLRVRHLTLFDAATGLLIHRLDCDVAFGVT